jgi:hypothetical protein
MNPVCRLDKGSAGRQNDDISIDARCVLANFKKTKGFAELADQESLNQKAAFRLEELESGKYTPQRGWLKEVWGKWPGDESIQELLAALKKS